MLYQYLLTFIKFIAGLMNEKRLIAISLIALGVMALWVILSLTFSFLRKFNKYCSKMYNLLKSQPKTTIHDTMLNNYAANMSAGFSRGFKKFKNSASGKPSQFITREEALEFEISGGVLNQGKSLMKFFIATVSVIVFILNLSFHVAGETITGSVLAETLALPLVLYFALKILYYIYTILKQYLYKTDITDFYDLLDLLDETYGNKNIHVENEEHEDVDASSENVTDEPVLVENEEEKINENDELIFDKVEYNPKDETEVEEKSETEPAEMYVENEVSEEPENEEAMLEDSDDSKDLAEDDEKAEAGEILNQISVEEESEESNEDEESVSPDFAVMGRKIHLKSQANLSDVYDSLAEFEVKKEDLDKIDPRVIPLTKENELDVISEIKVAKEREEENFDEAINEIQNEEPENLADDLTFKQEESHEESETIDNAYQAVDEEIKEERAVVEEEPSSESLSEAELDSNELPGGAYYGMTNEEILEKYDFFKKKNIDVNKLSGEIPNSSNSLPFINVDSNYVIKDDEQEHVNKNREMLDEEKKKREEEEKAKTEKLKEEQAKTAKKQDDDRQKELARLLGKGKRQEENDADDSSKEEIEETETFIAEEVNEVLKEEEPASIEERPISEETQAESEEIKIERVRPNVKASTNNKSNGYEIQFNKMNQNTAPVTRRRAPRSKLASGGVEIEINQPKPKKKQEEVEVQQLKTSDDVGDLIKSVHNSASVENSVQVAQEKKNKTIEDFGGEIKLDKIEKRVQGDIMLLSETPEEGKIVRRVKVLEKNNDAEPKQKIETQEKKQENSKKTEEKKNKNTSVTPKKDSKESAKSVKPKLVTKTADKESEDMTNDEKKSRGRPKKQIFDENVQIKSDKEFNIALSRAEKLMKKSEEGLSASQSKRIEKELKTLIDAMNKYKEEK